MIIEKLTPPVFKELFDQAMDEWNDEFNDFRMEVYYKFDKKFVHKYLDTACLCLCELRNIPISDRNGFIIRMEEAYAHETGNIVGEYD